MMRIKTDQHILARQPGGRWLWQAFGKYFVAAHNCDGDALCRAARGGGAMSGGLGLHQPGASRGLDVGWDNRHV